MDENQIIQPWEKPKIKNILTIFNAVVVKVNTTVRKVDTNEKVYR